MPDPLEVTEEELAECYFRGVSALERGDITRARRELDVLVLDAPRFAPAWDALARCHEAEGDLRRAEECFRRAMRLDRGNWLSRYHWALALHRSGRHAEACRWLRSAQALAPAERKVSLRLGQCLVELGEVEKGLRVLQAALEQPEREVRDSEVHLAIAAAELDRGDLEAADAACERACLLSPDDPEVYHQWALVSAQAGDLAAAERLARRTEALDRRSLRAPLLLVELALQSGDWIRAGERIQALAAREDGRRLSVALSAELARRQGRVAEAHALALDTLRHPGPSQDAAVDRALATLRQLHEAEPDPQGFRLVVEVDCGLETYYRPYVVLAQSEDEALAYVAELQDELDPHPWQLLESETFDHQGEALPGVYQLQLKRVLFPKAC